MYHYQAAPMRPANSSAHIVIAWVFAVLTLGYLLPWAIAATRQRSDALLNGVITFFFGWSIVGWIACLVWSLLTERPPIVAAPPVIPIPVQQYPQPTWQQPYQNPQPYAAQPASPPAPPPMPGQQYPTDPYRHP